MATLTEVRGCPPCMEHTPRRRKKLKPFDARRLARYIPPTECPLMAGPTLKRSDTKSRFKTGLCASSDVKCNGALNIGEGTPMQAM